VHGDTYIKYQELPTPVQVAMALLGGSRLMEKIPDSRVDGILNTFRSESKRELVAEEIRKAKELIKKRGVPEKDMPDDVKSLFADEPSSSTTTTTTSTTSAASSPTSPTAVRSTSIISPPHIHRTTTPSTINPHDHSSSSSLTTPTEAQVRQTVETIYRLGTHHHSILLLTVFSSVYLMYVL